MTTMMKIPAKSSPIVNVNGVEIRMILSSENHPVINGIRLLSEIETIISRVRNTQGQEAATTTLT